MMKNTSGEGALHVRLKKYLAREREKIRDLSFSEKVGYIAEYYWIWILGTAAALFFLIYIPYRMFFANTDYWFYAIYANTSADAGNQSPLWYDFAAWGGYDLHEKGIEMNAASYFDPTVRGGTVNSYFQAFVAVAESGALDVLTMDSYGGIQGVGASGRLADLGTEAYGEVREFFGDSFEDRLVRCIPYDEEYSREPVPVAIDVSDSLLMTKYHLYGEHCYLAVAANTGRMESVIAFLHFLYPEGGTGPSGSAEKADPAEGAGPPDIPEPSEAAGAPDTAVSPDMAGSPDTAVSPDMAGSPDTAVSPDMAGFSETAASPDMAGSPDTAGFSETAASPDTAEPAGAGDGAEPPGAEGQQTEAA